MYQDDVASSQVEGRGVVKVPVILHCSDLERTGRFCREPEPESDTEAERGGVFELVL